MRKTEKLGLALYDTSDKMNITGEAFSLNHNMELIDSGISAALEAAQNADAAAAAANAAAAAAQEAADTVLPQVNQLKAGLNKYIRGNERYEVGSITISGENAGKDDDTTDTRARTRTFYNLKSVEKIVCAAGAYSLRYYDDHGWYVGSGKYSAWLTYPEYDVSDGAPENACFVRVVVKYSDDSSITDVTPLYEMVKVLTKASRLNEIEAELSRQERTGEQYETGMINFSGNESASANRARTRTFFRISAVEKIVCANGSYALRYYDQHKNFISLGARRYWLTYPEYDVSDGAPDNAYYVRLVVKYNDDSAITDLAPLYEMVKVLTKASRLDEVEEAFAERIDASKESLAKHIRVNAQYEVGSITISGAYGGRDDNTTNTRARTGRFFKISEIEKIVCAAGAYSLRYYDKDGKYLGTGKYSGWITNPEYDVSDGAPDNAYYVRAVVRYPDNSTITDVSQIYEMVKILTTSTRLDEIEEALTKDKEYQIHKGHTGNVSILCAKEHTYHGDYPIIEYYLVAECGTNKIYYSKDLKSKQYMFTFKGIVDNYAFGITGSGDVICVYSAMSIEPNTTPSDDNRQNPYVFLASENWEIQHEVDFGAGLKPCGWLGNYGFRVLPDGEIVFCEYTRTTVLTANIWKVTDDLLNPSNWNVKFSMALSGNGEYGLKHFHAVQYDHFTDIVYMSTGDLDSSASSEFGSGAYIYASKDRGETWELVYEDSMKYCRALNYIFTEDYIYWAEDWYDNAGHYLFKCPRKADGMMDINNIQDYVHIPDIGARLSTYTTCYMPEIEAILLLERTDGGNTKTSIPIRAVDLANGTLQTLATVESATGEPNGLGFRTRYSEVYPTDCVEYVGFCFVAQWGGTAVNRMKLFGNQADILDGSKNVNNLRLRVYRKQDGSLGLKIDTLYI